MEREPSYPGAGGEAGNQEAMAAAEVSRLGLAWLCTLHTVRIQTDLRGFARQKVRERGGLWDLHW